MNKRHENVNATPATAQLHQKVRVAAVALTLFYCCDTSNEILTKMTSESIGRHPMHAPSGFTIAPCRNDSYRLCVCVRVCVCVCVYVCVCARACTRVRV